MGNTVSDGKCTLNNSFSDTCRNHVLENRVLDRFTYACKIKSSCRKNNGDYVPTEAYFVTSQYGQVRCGASNQNGTLSLYGECETGRAKVVWDNERKAEEKRRKAEEERRKAEEERRKAEEERKKKLDDFIASQRDKKCLTYGARNENVHMRDGDSCIRAGEKYVVGENNVVVMFENESDIKRGRYVRVNYPEYECKGEEAYKVGVHQLIDRDCLQRMEVEKFTSASAARPDGHLRLVDGNTGNPLSFVCNISSSGNECKLPQCMSSICK